jgi:hypothetical protein
MATECENTFTNKSLLLLADRNGIYRYKQKILKGSNVVLLSLL